MFFERIRRPGEAGFNLVELVVVVAVIGILMAAGMPTFLGYLKTSSLKGGAQEVVSALNQGRQLAIKNNETVCVKANTANGTFGTKIRFLRGNCTTTTMCGSSPCIFTGAGTDASGFITLANRMEINPPATDVQFTYLGAANATSTFTVRSMDNTSGTATVTIATSGRISYSFP
jgi:prepilin-type N-terminal cleavage/methylation domain-containing protein